MRRLIGSLAAILGVGLGPAVSHAKAIAADQAPPAWIAYAQASMQAITARLNAEAAPAPRVRAVLDATRPAPDQPTPPLTVKLWVDGGGSITRVDFQSLGDVQADQDLHALLEGQSLTPPPRGMRQPMRVALQLPPASSPVAAAQTGGTVH